jgi:hypothetical protein
MRSRDGRGGGGVGGWVCVVEGVRRDMMYMGGLGTGWDRLGRRAGPGWDRRGQAWAAEGGRVERAGGRRLAGRGVQFCVNIGKDGPGRRRYDEQGWAYRPSAVHQRCMPRPARRRAPAKTVWFHCEPRRATTRHAATGGASEGEPEQGARRGAQREPS